MSDDLVINEDGRFDVGEPEPQEEQNENPAENQEPEPQEPEYEEPEPQYSEEPEESDEPQWTEEDAELAKKFGWKAPEDWKGDRSGLIEDPREYLAIQARRLEDTGELRSQLEATRRELLRLSQTQEERFRKDDERTLASIRSEMDKAFELGDKRRYQSLLEEYDKLKSAPEPEGDEYQVPEQVQRATADPVFQSWAQQNSWYIHGQTGQGSFEDTAKVRYADKVAAELLNRTGIASPLELHDTARRDFYDTVAREVNRAYGAPQQRKAMNSGMPSDPPRRQAAATPRKNSKQGFSNMPEEAQEGFRMWVRKGVYKDTEKERAEYAKDYFAEASHNR